MRNITTYQGLYDSCDFLRFSVSALLLLPWLLQENSRAAMTINNCDVELFFTELPVLDVLLHYYTMLPLAIRYYSNPPIIDFMKRIDSLRCSPMYYAYFVTIASKFEWRKTTADGVNRHGAYCFPLVACRGSPGNIIFVPGLKRNGKYKSTRVYSYAVGSIPNFRGTFALLSYDKPLPVWTTLHTPIGYREGVIY